MTTLWAFVKLSRPHFLLGGALLYALGAAHVGLPGLPTYLLGQAMVTFAQVTAHFVNEYADVTSDRDIVRRTLFSGGSGVLTSGALAPRVSLRAGAITTILTFGCAALILPTSPLAAALGIAAVTVSWAYSMPPLRLLDTGWGEGVTTLVVVGLVPIVGTLVAGGPITVALGWVIATLAPIHFAMMLAFSLPDVDSDRSAGKTVLAVRIGVASTKRLLVLLVIGAAITGIVATGIGALDATLPLIASTIPAGLMVAAAYRDRPHLLTGSAVATLVAYVASTIRHFLVT